MKRHHLLVGFAVLCVSLFMTTQAFARESNSDGGQNGRSNAVVFMNRQELLRTAKSFGLTVRRVELSTREKAKLLSSKACSCAAAQEGDAFGSCFTNCLKSNGVNPMAIAACGSTCSVNLIGCAICVGVGEWVVLGCAQYCVWGRFIRGSLLEAPVVKLRPSQIRGSHQAKLLLKPTPMSP